MSGRKRCTGTAIRELSPLTLFQIISLRAYMGARSNPEKSILRLALAPGASLAFFAFTSIIGLITLKGVTIGVAANEAYIGIAAASYWLMGGSPRNSSIDRTIEMVQYT